MSIYGTILRGAVIVAAPLALAACTMADSSRPEVAASAAISDLTVGQKLAQIMSWWPGDYNNDRQLARLEAEGKPIWRADDSGKGGHIEVTSHYRVVDMPEFGENVLYVEETKHGDPSNIFRQRIYELYVDEQSNTVRVTLWTFKDREKYVGAWRDLSRLEGLTKEEVSSFGRSCDLVTAQQGGKYHLAMGGKECAFGENYFSYQVLLGPDTFSFRDKVTRLADEVVISQAGEFTYHELDRLGQ